MNRLIPILLLALAFTSCSASKASRKSGQTEISSSESLNKDKKEIVDYEKVYPDSFENAIMDVPNEPNVEFSFVVKAPKSFVMDAWNLPRVEGGKVEVCTAGNQKAVKKWPGITDDMERVLYLNGIAVTQIVGNVQTPETGDWHFEWKAGKPYYKMPFPFGLIMKSVHGQATLSEGPNENETTVTITNRHTPGISLGFTKFGIKAAMPGLSKKAPKRFKKGVFLGPG